MKEIDLKNEENANVRNWFGGNRIWVTIDPSGYSQFQHIVNPDGSDASEDEVVAFKSPNMRRVERLFSFVPNDIREHEL